MNRMIQNAIVLFFLNLFILYLLCVSIPPLYHEMSKGVLSHTSSRLIYIQVKRDNKIGKIISYNIIAFSELEIEIIG